LVLFALITVVGAVMAVLIMTGCCAMNDVRCTVQSSHKKAQGGIALMLTAETVACFAFLRPTSCGGRLSEGASRQRLQVYGLPCCYAAQRTYYSVMGCDELCCELQCVVL
jgi:hypothetical protein